MWGLAFYLIVIGLRSFPPITLVAYRLITGAVMLYLLMRWQGLSLPREACWWLHFSLLSIMGNLLPFTLIAWAETRIPSSQAGLIMALMPISTMLLAHYFVAHEQLTSRRVVGVLLGFGGVTILVGGSALEGLGGEQILGQIACVIATFAYAVNAVYAKRLPKINGLVVGAGSLIAGSLIWAPVAVMVDQPWTLVISTNALWAATALGVLGTGIATWAYFVLLSDCGPNFVSSINYIVPAIAFAAGVFLLSEPADASQFAGLIVICAGIAISRSKPRGNQ